MLATRPPLRRRGGRAIVGVIVALVALFAVGSVGIDLLSGQASHAADDLRDSNRRSEAVHAVLDSVQDAEAAQRGALITGQDWSLKAFERSVSDVEERLASLATVFAALPELEVQQKVRVISTLGRARLLELSRAVRSQAELGSTLAVPRDDPRWFLHERLVNEVSDLLALERAETRHRMHLATIESRNTITVAWVVGFAVLTLMVLALFRVRRDLMALVDENGHLQLEARRDQLTHLPNRASFLESLRDDLVLKQSDGRAAVLFIDLDGFKGINDDLGHDVGDHVLVTTAITLRSAIGPSDVLARLGGDEFVVLATSAADHAAVSALVGRIEQALDGISLAVLRGHRVRASVGWAIYPDDAVSAEGLLGIADQMMYRAKARSRRLPRSRLTDSATSDESAPLAVA